MGKLKKTGVVAGVLVAALLAIGVLDRAMGSGLQTSAYSLILNAGSALTMRQTINCGSGVTCADDAGNNRTNITVSAGANPSISINNAGSTGTTINTLTKLTGAPSTAVISSAGDTAGAVGITTAGAGTTSTATITIAGQVSCVFDAATTAGDYVQISATVAGNCHDTGSGSYPGSNQVVGRILSTNGMAGTYTIDLFPSEIQASTGGGGGGYTTIQNSGTALTARTTLNFRNGLGCGDSGSLTQCIGTLGGPPPAAGSFTWVNQGGAAVTSAGGVINMLDSANEAGLHLNCIAATPPYTITAQFNWNYIPSAGVFPYPAVLGFRDSASGKIEIIEIVGNTTAFPPQIGADQWTNATTFSGTLLTSFGSAGDIRGFQIQDDNTTNKTWSYSIDGIVYTTAKTEARTTFLTANQVCWGLRSNSSATQTEQMTLTGWLSH